jgi:hypothetical protein
VDDVVVAGERVSGNFGIERCLIGDQEAGFSVSRAKIELEVVDPGFENLPRRHSMNSVEWRGQAEQ